MERLFSGSSYSTPAGIRRPLLARLLGWSRVPFFWYVAREIRASKRAVAQGRFDAPCFVQHAEGVIRGVELCGGTVSVTGMEHLSAVADPVVLVGNHMSFLETFVLPAMVLPRRPMSFVVKESLVDDRWVGVLLATLDPIPLGRVNPRDDLRTLLQEGRKRLEAGRSVCVFPQSTRSSVFDRAKFNSIGAKLAQRNGCPIIPFALRTDFMANGSLVKDFGPVHPERAVHFAFGAPIDSHDAKAAQRQVVDFVVAHASEWGVRCI